MILAGDIGGTKTALALFEEESDGRLRQVRELTAANADYASFEEIARLFLREGPRPALHAAVLAAAGPIIGGHCQVTNLAWVLDEQELARVLGTPRVKLLNDLEAAGYGMLHLPPEEYAVLNEGRPRRSGNIAVLSAGTGLGEALLYWDGRQHHPTASEGGHADFAPRTEQEIELLRSLRAQLGDDHVSCERVLSGSGIQNVYRFLRDSGVAPEPPWLAERLRTGDASAAITALGVNGEDPLCAATVELFAAMYGAEAGNLALKYLAVGGVFVGGNIAVALLPVLQKSGFMHAFTDKGRFRDLLQSIEVRVALNPRAPLLGAAYFALRL